MRRLRHSALVPLATVLLAACGGAKAPPLSTVDDKPVPIKRLERTYARVMKKARIPAISCVVLNDGEIAYANTFGVKSLESGAPADLHTVFAAASFSKTVFAYLVMLLVEDGKLRLDVPLESYLGFRLADDPQWADLAGDLRTTRITGRQALSHTIGFPNWRFLEDDGRLKLLFEPGAQFHYSGEGISLLQRVVEKVTGKGLEELAAERIFEPLRMVHTSYVWQDAFEINHALPHDEYGRVRRHDRRLEADASGSMYTTATDFARFLTAIHGASGRRAETVEKMLALQVAIDTEGMFGPPSRRRTGAYRDLELGWSLGWGRFETERGPAFFHTGHDFGWQNYTVYDRDLATGIVLLSNSNNFESVARELVATAVGEDGSPFDWIGYPRFDPALMRRQPPPDPVVVEVDQEILSGYVGEFLFMGDKKLAIKLEHGRLWASTGSGDWAELAATSDTEFFVPGDDARFRFVREGAMSRPVILVEGLEIQTERVEIGVPAE